MGDDVDVEIFRVLSSDRMVRLHMRASKSGLCTSTELSFRLDGPRSARHAPRTRLIDSLAARAFERKSSRSIPLEVLVSRCWSTLFRKALSSSFC